jgi:hypothetical protein
LRLSKRRGISKAVVQSINPFLLNPDIFHK